MDCGLWIGGMSTPIPYPPPTPGDCLPEHIPEISNDRHQKSSGPRVVADNFPCFMSYEYGVQEPGIEESKPSP